MSLDAQIDAALQRLLAHGSEQSRSLGEEHTALWSSVEAATEGGKRLRPTLLTTTYAALGGRDLDMAAALGAALELLHTAFVIHDDLIDGDTVRRGRPNVAGSFAGEAARAGADPRQADHVGATAALLAGDLALAGAVRGVATCGAAPDVTRRLLDLFDRALHVTAAGELSDVRLGLRLAPGSLGEILTMEERKTAVYSFELPLQAGAVLARAPECVVERLGEAGRLLGVAFQLLDDLQGMFGDPAVTGKSARSDLRGGKQTPLIAHSRSTAAWGRIAPHVGDPAVTPRAAEDVRRLLEECGSRRFVEELAAGYVIAALEVFDTLPLPADFAELVTATAQGLVRSAA